MCLTVRNQMFKMMGDLWRQNENKVANLEYWDLIEKRITALPM